MPTLNPPDYTEGDWLAVVRLLELAHEAGVDDSAEVVGRGAVAAHEYAQRRAAQLIGKAWNEETHAWGPPVRDSYAIDGALRDKAAKAVQQVIDEGGDVGQLHEALLNSFGDIPGRALMIAATETALAYNEGSLANYADMGVEMVEVLDGGTAGSCDACEVVNGETWSVADAADNPIEHPNCTRSFIPVLQGG